MEGMILSTHLSTSLWGRSAKTTCEPEPLTLSPTTTAIFTGQRGRARPLYHRQPALASHQRFRARGTHLNGGSAVVVVVCWGSEPGGRTAVGAHRRWRGPRDDNVHMLVRVLEDGPRLFHTEATEARAVDVYDLVIDSEPAIPRILIKLISPGLLLKLR